MNAGSGIDERHLLCTVQKNGVGDDEAGWQTVIRGRATTIKEPWEGNVQPNEAKHAAQTAELFTQVGTEASDIPKFPTFDARSTTRTAKAEIHTDVDRHGRPVSGSKDFDADALDEPDPSTELWPPISGGLPSISAEHRSASTPGNHVNGSNGISTSGASTSHRETKRVRKLSGAVFHELTSSLESALLHPAPYPEQVSPGPQIVYEHQSGRLRHRIHNPSAEKQSEPGERETSLAADGGPTSIAGKNHQPDAERPDKPGVELGHRAVTSLESTGPTLNLATLNSRYSARRAETYEQSGRSGKLKRHASPPLLPDSNSSVTHSRTARLRSASPGLAASPMPPSIPLPPQSLPTYLQLELSSSRPSPLYIHRSAATDFPYESSKIKFERLVDFLLLPPQLELTLWFGALACLDCWLYTFTILPLRFFIALGVLGRWWSSTMVKEIGDLSHFVFWGLGRLWKRSGRRPDNQGPSFRKTSQPLRKPRSRGKSTLGSASSARRRLATFTDQGSPASPNAGSEQRRLKAFSQKHRRSKSTPSALLADHKADLLQGLVVLFSCLVLLRFDASRMYHGIRGQAAIKLYVIYNVLEVCDRLFSALGQDVFECLFSKETLERTPSGRSKLLRPFGMFLLALTYNVIHSTALFYQVITLNVAVNSYSNALLTLLMSNQFVEIKSTVFKKFEKENLFQLTCADVVERFQLWLMLLIIAFRNVAEVGGLSLGGSSPSFWGSVVSGLNGTSANPVGSGNAVPKSFTMFPKWTGQVLGPFLLVLGSEMLVDWLKHAYITKFNNTKPAIYGRFLDVLAKDYYSNAFSDQNLTKRLGLPVIPLSCLFIRASLQTYHMFLATSVPLPLPSSATSLSVESSVSSSPATTAALQQFDVIIRRALGRSSFGAGTDASSTEFASFTAWRSQWTVDDAIAFATMVVFFLGVFLVLLALKLALGMFLLAFARRRYRGMKEREKEDVSTGGRRIGGLGVVEVDDDKRRWIYLDDPEGAKASREREKKTMMTNRDQQNGQGGGNMVDSFSGISRYSMVAKRIW